MPLRTSLLPHLAVACLVVCASAIAEVATVNKPATECPVGVLFARFNVYRGCTSECPFPWDRLWKKVDGDWADPCTGRSENQHSADEFRLEPGAYKLEVLCHNESDENWPPQSGWQLCAYLSSWVATIEVRRKGSTGTWDGSTNVAAGGKSSDVHKAEVRVTAYPPIAGLPIEVTIVEGGAGKPGTGCPATLDMPSVTGADGVAIGTLTSSNLKEDVVLALKPAGIDHTFDTARVNQRWDHENGGEWEYDAWFIPNAPSDVSWTLEIDDDGEVVPMTGHTAKFYAQRVVYYLWDDDLQEYVRHEEERSPDNNWDLSCFSEFTPAQTQDSGNGVYTSQQVVYEDDVYFDWFVDEVYFRGVDDDTYVQ